MKNLATHFPLNEQAETFQLIVSEHEAPVRVDRFITQKLPSYSRSFFQKLLADECIVLNGSIIHKPSTVLRHHDHLLIRIPPPPPLGIGRPFEGDLGVRVIFEHPHFLIIFKPAGLTVHSPRQGSAEITLVDWLMSAFAELASVGAIDRPGIVHRLDKDTSGLMIIARTNYAHMTLSDLFKNRAIKKTYLAVVKGHPAPEGTISYPISRHPTNKHKMTHVDEKKVREWNLVGREATTHYRVLENLKDAALIEASPVTGRTHQIRVHCTALGHPIIGDTTYGIRSPHITRQALHAQSLRFEFEGTPFEFVQEAPEDFMRLVQELKK